MDEQSHRASLASAMRAEWRAKNKHLVMFRDAQFEQFARLREKDRVAACPFCLTANKTRISGHYDKRKGNYVMQVVCDGCGTRGPYRIGDYTPTGGQPEYLVGVATTAWNLLVTRHA